MYFDDTDNGLRSNRKRCANCRYREYDKMQGYVCCNDSSEYVADFVEYNFCCVDYEEK